MATVLQRRKSVPMAFPRERVEGHAIVVPAQCAPQPEDGMEPPHIDASGECGRGVVYVPVSWGELVDKIAILEIKAARIPEPGKLDHVQRELTALRAVRDREGPISEAAARAGAALARVNLALWEVEDALRSLEREGRFDAEFLDLARSVYRHNDRRAALKRRISLLMDSRFVEEKSYWPGERDLGAVLDLAGLGPVGDGRLLADAVDADVDQVAEAAGFDHDAAGLAVEHEGHRDDHLERIALGAAGRTDIGFPRSDPDSKVEHHLHRRRVGCLVRCPGPRFRRRRAVTSTTGAMPASSQASKALSTSSFRSTTGHTVRGWPIWAVSSFSDMKSSNRLVRNAVRSAEDGAGWGTFREPVLRGKLEIAADGESGPGHGGHWAWSRSRTTARTMAMSTTGRGGS